MREGLTQKPTRLRCVATIVAGAFSVNGKFLEVRLENCKDIHPLRLPKSGLLTLNNFDNLIEAWLRYQVAL